MLVDDSRMNLRHLGNLISGILRDPEIYEFINPRKALEHISLYSDEISLVITDHRMPTMTGQELIEKIRLTEDMEYKIPILVLTAVEDKALQEEMYKAGANGFLRRPITESLLRKRILNLIETKQANDRSIDKRKLVREREKFISFLGSVISVRTHQPEALERRSKLAKLIALRHGLNADIVWRVSMAMYLCDIGKAGLPAFIRDVATAQDLSPADRIIYQSHVAIGYELLENSKIGKLHELAHPILHHCEQWDGSGYPQGLKGQDIPIESRIISIANAFDEAYGKNEKRFKTRREVMEETVGEIMEHSGTALDPELVWLLRDNNNRKEIEKIYGINGEGLNVELLAKDGT